MNIDEIVAALQAIIDGAKNDDGTDRPLTDEEADRYEELEGKLTAARKSAEIRSRQQAYTTPLRGDLHVNTGHGTAEDPVERAFEHYLRTGQPNADIAEFRAQSEGTNSAGGYIVPSGFRAKLIERMEAFGGIAEAAEVMSTSDGQPLEYPTVDDTANVGEIVAEGGTFAAGADVVFGIRTLSAYKYMAGGAGNTPLKVSWELLQDSAFDVRAFLARTLGTRIARLQATHWATGTGTGQPQGLVTPLTTIGAIAGAAPTYAELLATVHALDPEYRTGASWVMNDASWAEIAGLLDANNRPLVMQSTDSISGRIGQATLMGYPVIIDQAMPDSAAGGKFLAFGDIREAYVIRRVQDVTLVVLNEMYAANGQTGFMAWARADGAVQNPNAAVVRTAAA